MGRRKRCQQARQRRQQLERQAALRFQQQAERELQAKQHIAANVGVSAHQQKESEITVHDVVASNLQNPGIWEGHTVTLYSYDIEKANDKEKGWSSVVVTHFRYNSIPRGAGDSRVLRWATIKDVRYVVKQYYVLQNPEDPSNSWTDEEVAQCHRVDVQMQHLASLLAMKFNELLKNCCKTGRVSFNKTSVITFIKNKKLETMMIEPEVKEMYNRFIKFNNNAGGLGTLDPKKRTSAWELAQAFSHWTHFMSNGQILVVDLQGIITDGEGLLLTDPQIHASDSRKFGIGNSTEDGRNFFFETHECNSFCDCFLNSSARWKCESVSEEKKQKTATESSSNYNLERKILTLVDHSFISKFIEYAELRPLPPKLLPTPVTEDQKKMLELVLSGPKKIVPNNIKAPIASQKNHFFLYFVIVSGVFATVLIPGSMFLRYFLRSRYRWMFYLFWSCICGLFFFHVRSSHDNKATTMRNPPLTSITVKNNLTESERCFLAFKYSHATYFLPKNDTNIIFPEDHSSYNGCLVAVTDKAIIVAFRGTRITKITDIVCDLKAQPVVMEPRIKGNSSFEKRCHRGFWQHRLKLNTSQFWKLIADKKNREIIITGHSLGGAAAILFTLDVLEGVVPPENIFCITFGAPCSINDGWITHINHSWKSTLSSVFTNYVNDRDVIPVLPLIWSYRPQKFADIMSLLFPFQCNYFPIGKLVILFNEKKEEVFASPIPLNLPFFINIDELSKYFISFLSGDQRVELVTKTIPSMEDHKMDMYAKRLKIVM